ncbi:MAG: hypothetical protein ACLVAW_28685 [Eisenbergiella massiliensis]
MIRDSQKVKKTKKSFINVLYRDFCKNKALHLMLLPCLVLLAVYSYVPLVGLKMAFERFIPSKGLFGNQKFVGMYWFKYLFSMDDFFYALQYIVISCSKLILTMLTSIIFAILINEMRNRKLKRTADDHICHILSPGLFWPVYLLIFYRPVRVS